MGQGYLSLWGFHASGFPYSGRAPSIIRLITAGTVGGQARPPPTTVIYPLAPPPNHPLSYPCRQPRPVAESDHRPLRPLCPKVSQNVPFSKKSAALANRQQAVLPILASSPSVSQAARNSGISRRTLTRWLQDPDFREQLADFQKQRAELAKGCLQELSLQATLSLGEYLQHPNLEIRLRAIRTILEFSGKFTDIQALQEQVQTLDAALPLWADHANPRRSR